MESRPKQQAVQASEDTMALPQNVPKPDLTNRCARPELAELVLFSNRCPARPTSAGDPIVIVVMVLAATATIAAVWGRHGWATGRRCVVVRTARSSHRTRSWAAGHLAPNTYTSILMLAAFTFEG